MPSIHDPNPAWNWGLREKYGHLPVGQMEPAPVEINTVWRPKGCLLDVFDIRLVMVGPGASIAEMPLMQAQMNQRGIAQAGAVMALADAAAGWATMPALPDNTHFTTLELKANMLRASRLGDTLRAEVKPVHVGSSTIVLDVLVFNPEARDKPIAKFSCTQLVLRQREPKAGASQGKGE